MQRSKFLILLSHDHHHGLKLAQLIKKGAPAYKKLPNDLVGKVNYTLKFWRSDLSKHFKEEEEILFPPVKGKNKELDEIIEEVLVEHKLIEKKIKTLYKAGDPVDILNDLSILLKNHIRKEERIVFDKIEKIVNTDEQEQIGFRLKESRVV
jgi:iron-sulfur cluster repair protein YtfE (RIC family)